MSYGIHVRGYGFLRSGDIQARLARFDSPEAFAQIAEIERLECRGIQYSNQDVDVLSEALRVLRELKLTPRFHVGDRVNLSAAPNAIPQPQPAINGLTVDTVKIVDNSCPHIRLVATDTTGRLAEACQDNFELCEDYDQTDIDNDEWDVEIEMEE